MLYYYKLYLLTLWMIAAWHKFSKYNYAIAFLQPKYLKALAFFSRLYLQFLKEILGSQSEFYSYQFHLKNQA